MLEIQVLRRLGLYGPKKEEVTGRRRALPYGKFHDLKCPLSTIRVIKASKEIWWHMCHMWEIMKVYRGFPEGKRKLGRPRLRRDDIKLLLQKRDERASGSVYIKWWASMNKIMKFRFS